VFPVWGIFPDEGEVLLEVELGVGVGLWLAEELDVPFEVGVGLGLGLWVELGFVFLRCAWICPARFELLGNVFFFIFGELASP
jgi:hypothetical protein